MADINGSKTYQVTYNVVANAGEAASQFTNLANVVQRITKSGTGMAKFNQQVRDIVRNTERLSTALGSFSPRLDMKTFNSQLRVMENAVAASAKTMQGMINAALTGNTKALQRATAKRGSWSQAIRDGLVADKKVLEKDLSNYKKELDRLMTMRRSGTTDGRLMTAQEIQRNNARIKSVQRQISSLENSLSSMTGSLAVLRKEASGGNTLKGLTVPANMAKGAEDLTKMSNAVKSWNKAVGNLTKKSVTFKINAIDNASGTINAIKTKIGELQAMAANIFIGGGQKTPAKTQQKAQRVRRPAGVMSERDIKDLGTLKDNVTRLATTRANGLWSKSYQEQYNQFASVASKVTGLPENTDMNTMMRALRAKHKEELQKYNNWKNSLAKSAKPASKPPITPSTTPQTPTAMTQLNNMAGTLRSLQGLADKNGVRISTRLNRTGILARGITGYETMQKLANTHPIMMRGIFNGTEAGFGLNQTLVNLQNLANSRPIIIRGVFNGGGAGFGLNQSIGNLTRLSEQNPVAVKSALKGAKSVYTKPNLTKSAIPGNIAAISKLGEEFNKQIKPLNLQLNTEAAKAKFREFIKYIQSNNKVKVTLNATTGGGRGRAATGSGGVPPIIPVGGTSSTAPIGTTKNPVIVASKGDANPMKRWSYPLTGNTSFGARTPAAVEMMKGMGVMMAIGGAMQGVGTAFSQATEYQNTMTTARAILKNNYNGSSFDSDFATMERVLRREGIQTKFTAAEEAGAAKFLAMAGLDMSTIKNAIKPVTNVALAGDLDLATTADKMTNIMTAFKLKSPSDFSHTADVLANTFTRSNTSMMQLAESAQYAAPIASARGMSLEEMMALIGVMGDAGIQGSMAGTSLRMMMNNIYNPSKTQAKMWEHLAKLGVTKRGSNGEWLNVTDILNQIAQKVPEKELADVMGRLFRVTSVAGATQLAKNIGKVKSLYSSNVTSNGVAESIRAERITNIQGRWAQVVSTFQEDILKLFEAPAFQEKLIALLEKFRSILAKPETLKSLEAVMDLLLFFGETMGQMAKIFLNVYNAAPGLIKFMMKFQIFMTAIGSYLLTPIIQFANLFNMLRAPLGILGGGALAAGAANGGSAAAGTAGATVASSAPIISFGNKKPKYNTAGINAARSAVAQSEKRLLNSRKYLAAATAVDVATTSGIQRSIEKKQMQWWVASQYAGSGPGSHALRSSDNRSARWNLAYTNPQAASELPNRFNIMGAREKEIAALQEQLRRRSANLSTAEAAVLANTASNMQAHRELNKRIADVRHGARRANSLVLNRAVQMGKISRGRAIGMSLSSGFRTAATWGVTGLSISGIMSGFTKVVGTVGKALGLLVNPITLVVAAIGGIITTMISMKRRLERERGETKEAIDSTTPTAQADAARNKKLKSSLEIGNIIPINANEKSSSIYGRTKPLNPMMKNAGFKGLYKKEYTNESLRKLYENYIAPYSESLYGKQITFGEFVNKYQNVNFTQTGPLAMGGGLFKTIDNSKLFDEINRGAYMSLALRTPQVQKAREDAYKLISEWSKLPVGQKEIERGNLITQLEKIRDQFDYENAEDISGKDVKNMRVWKVFHSKQGQRAAWELINSLIGNKYSSKVGTQFAMDSIRNEFEYGKDWMDSFDKIASSTPFAINDRLGQMKVFTVEFKNGLPIWENLSKQIANTNMDFGDVTAKHLDILISIAERIKNDPALYGLQSLSNYLNGLINYIRNFDAKKYLSDARNDMFNSVAPTNVPIFDFKPTYANGVPESIGRPIGYKNTNYFQRVDDVKRKRSVESRFAPSIYNDDAMQEFNRRGKETSSISGGGSYNISLFENSSVSVRNDGDLQALYDHVDKAFADMIGMVSDSYNYGNVNG